MPTRHKPHGESRVSQCGDIFLLHLSGASNKEGAERRGRKLQDFWLSAGAPARWGILVDLRAWEGATPESFAMAGDTLQWTLDNGLQASAMVVADELPRSMMERHIQRYPRAISTRIFRDMDTAFEWLISLGFEVEKPGS